MACGTEIGFTKSGCLQTPWLIVAGKPIIPKASVENASLISSHPTQSIETYLSKAGNVQHVRVSRRGGVWGGAAALGHLEQLVLSQTMRCLQLGWVLKPL